MNKRRVALGAAAALAVAGVAVPSVTAAAAQQTGHEPTFNRFIVNYDSTNVQAQSQGAHALGAAKSFGAHKLRDLSTGGAVVTTNPLDSAATKNLIATLSSQPGVSSVEVDRKATIQSTPDDPKYNKQWDLYEKTGGENVQPLYGGKTNGSGSTVAVIDTGITPHSDLNDNVIKGYDFITDPKVSVDGDGRDANPNDPGDGYKANECGLLTPGEKSSWHGTHVSGTIGAVTDNDKGVAGIAPKTNIEPVRVLGKCGGSFSDITDAVVWASGGKVPGVPKNQHPADVINMSLGGSGACPQSFQRAINTATKNGTTVAVAAGNDSDDASKYSPANCKNVITVAANDRQGNKAFYSNYGKTVDVTAPGGEVRNESDPSGSQTKPQDGILSTLNSGAQTQAKETYGPYMGTSMATPHIAGLAALMYGKDHSLTPAKVESLIKDNARKLPGDCSQGCGAGIADANATVKATPAGSAAKHKR